MVIKKQIENDLKIAMLAGDKLKVTTLRGLKSAILNIEVAEGSRETGLSDDKIIDTLSKEAKKRQEAADLYLSVGDKQKSDMELAEKAIILNYLPKQLSEKELLSLIQEIAVEEKVEDIKQLGILISKTKAKCQGTAEGSMIAKLAREYLVQ